MKRWLEIFGVGLILLSFLSVAYAQEFQQNLLFNYDFGARDVATNLPAAWDPEDYSQVESGIVAWDGDLGRSTIGSLKISSWDPVKTTITYVETIQAKPGNMASFSVWVKAELVKGNGATAKITYVKDGGESIGEKSASYISGTTSWKQLKIEDKVPEGAVGVVVSLEFDGQGVVWFDDSILLLK